jgi:6-phosphogluconolactonase
MSAHEPEVMVADSADALAADTAARTYEVLGAAVRDRGVAQLVVTGGSILEKVLGALADAPDGFDWSSVHVWWGDERYVPADSDDRNDLPALQLLFDRVGGQLHRMPASDAGFDSAEAAADAYAAELAAAAADGEVPNFDVILLGIGPDGHCASLFPDHPGTRVLDRAVIAVHESPKPPPDRLSLTFSALGAAEQIWVVASGDSKADAVARALGGAPREQVPSAGARGRQHTLWLLDQDAAARLDS